MENFAIHFFKQEALRREAIDTYQKLLKKGAYELFSGMGCDEIIEDLMDRHALLTTIKEEVTKLPPYRMITINFSEENENDALYVLDHFDKILKKKWIGECYYTIEFHTEDGKYSHPHIHAFVRLRNLKKKKSEIIREIHGTIQSMGITIAPQYIDLKSHKSGENGISYVKKTCEKKKKKGTKKDLEKYKYFNIQPYYKYSKEKADAYEMSQVSDRAKHAVENILNS